MKVKETHFLTVRVWRARKFLKNNNNKKRETMKGPYNGNCVELPVIKLKHSEFC